MASFRDAVVSRRNLLQRSAFTGVAAALSPALRLDQAQAADCSEFCNEHRPRTPAHALQALIKGNERWATFAQEHPGEDEERRNCAVKGQAPFAAIISCSDSRVPPELLFDQGIGDLFVARVAGNGATGTLTEGLYYGTSVLGALVLFVLGHSDCAAVRYAVTHFPHHELEFVRLIFPAVIRARHIVEEAGGDPNNPTEVIPVATDQNVILGVQALRTSPFFKKMVDNGTLLIAGGVYDLKTQQVTILIR
jgi:carbonic anhydrase